MNSTVKTGLLVALVEQLESECTTRSSAVLHKVYYGKVQSIEINDTNIGDFVASVARLTKALSVYSPDSPYSQFIQRVIWNLLSRVILFTKSITEKDTQFKLLRDDCQLLQTISTDNSVTAIQLREISSFLWEFLKMVNDISGIITHKFLNTDDRPLPNGLSRSIASSHSIWSIFAPRTKLSILQSISVSGPPTYEHLSKISRAYQPVEGNWYLTTQYLHSLETCVHESITNLQNLSNAGSSILSAAQIIDQMKAQVSMLMATIVGDNRVTGVQEILQTNSRKVNTWPTKLPTALKSIANSFSTGEHLAKVLSSVAMEATKEFSACYTLMSVKRLDNLQNKLDELASSFMNSNKLTDQTSQDFRVILKEIQAITDWLHTLEKTRKSTSNHFQGMIQTVDCLNQFKYIFKLDHIDPVILHCIVEKVLQEYSYKKHVPIQIAEVLQKCKHFFIVWLKPSDTIMSELFPVVYASVNYRYYRCVGTACRSTSFHGSIMGKVTLKFGGKIIPGVSVPFIDPTHANTGHTIDCESPTLVSHYTFSTDPSANASADPLSWEFYASNDNINFVLLDRKVGFGTPIDRGASIPDIAIRAAKPLDAEILDLVTKQRFGVFQQTVLCKVDKIEKEVADLLKLKLATSNITIDFTFFQMLRKDEAYGSLVQKSFAEYTVTLKPVCTEWTNQMTSLEGIALILRKLQLRSFESIWSFLQDIGGIVHRIGYCVEEIGQFPKRFSDVEECIPEEQATVQCLYNLKGLFDWVNKAVENIGTQSKATITLDMMINTLDELVHRIAHLSSVKQVDALTLANMKNSISTFTVPLHGFWSPLSQLLQELVRRTFQQLKEYFVFLFHEKASFGHELNKQILNNKLLEDVKDNLVQMNTELSSMEDICIALILLRASKQLLGEGMKSLEDEQFTKYCNIAQFSVSLTQIERDLTTYIASNKASEDSLKKSWFLVSSSTDKKSSSPPVATILRNAMQVIGNLSSSLSIIIEEQSIIPLRSLQFAIPVFSHFEHLCHSISTITQYGHISGVVHESTSKQMNDFEVYLLNQIRTIGRSMPTDGWWHIVSGLWGIFGTSFDAMHMIRENLEVIVRNDQEAHGLVEEACVMILLEIIPSLQSLCSTLQTVPSTAGSNTALQRYRSEIVQIVENTLLESIYASMAWSRVMCTSNKVQKLHDQYRHVIEPIVQSHWPLMEEVVMQSHYDHYHALEEIARCLVTTQSTSVGQSVATSWALHTVPQLLKHPHIVWSMQSTATVLANTSSSTSPASSYLHMKVITLAQETHDLERYITMQCHQVLKKHSRCDDTGAGNNGSSIYHLVHGIPGITLHSLPTTSTGTGGGPLSISTPMNVPTSPMPLSPTTNTPLTTPVKQQSRPSSAMRGATANLSTPMKSPSKLPLNASQSMSKLPPPSTPSRPNSPPRSYLTTEILDTRMYEVQFPQEHVTGGGFPKDGRFNKSIAFVPAVHDGGGKVHFPVRNHLMLNNTAITTDEDYFSMAQGKRSPTNHPGRR